MALFVDVDVVQEQQERQFHRQHVSFDAHGPNLLPERNKSPRSVQSIRESKYYPDLGAILGLKKALYGVGY